MEFVSMLGMLHTDRCFFPDLRNALGRAIAALPDFTAQVHHIEFAMVYKGLYSFQDSTDVLRQLGPVWTAVHSAARFFDLLGEVRIALDRLHDANTHLKVPEFGYSFWQDGSGAFSEMNFLQRQLFDGWHLDHGVLAWLLRFLEPPSNFNPSHGCHTSIADFGAGGGHYCHALNQTGEY